MTTGIPAAQTGTPSVPRGTLEPFPASEGRLQLQTKLHTELQTPSLGFVCSKRRPPAVLLDDCNCFRCTTTRPPRSTRGGVRVVVQRTGLKSIRTAGGRQKLVGIRGSDKIDEGLKRQWFEGRWESGSGPSTTASQRRAVGCATAAGQCRLEGS
jgi:hypothetical protein